ncbi:MAG TPA: PAS domain-containing protein [bacterium]|nr:PAS domain-containing protein [bacterium]
MIGKFPEHITEAILETLPVEISVLDADDCVLGWNRHLTRLFTRPEAALGRNVRDCHPYKSLDKIEAIISEMKAGTREKASFWIDLPVGPDKRIQKILIEFFALRDAEGKYLGCLEVGQNITPHRELTGEKRLLD